MELPRRTRGDELLKPGAMTDIRARVRALAPKHDLTTVIVSAFDHRTRILPFVFADTRIVPAGVRAIGSAMVDAGFEKTRIVLQQWNKNFAPSKMRLDGKIPDIFMVSGMHLASHEYDRLIKDACRIDPDKRPLIIAGGPRMFYEPWQVFSANPDQPWAADVAVTGEEYILLNMLEILLEMRAANESMRSVFLRARDSGALEEVPGLVYARGTRENAPAEELIDTGIQRLLQDLDELPHPVLGFGIIEAPGKGGELAPKALEPTEVRRHSMLSSLVMTSGCKFRCSYCPIPALNQSQFRFKSGERIASEIELISNTTGIRNFFGADDNFFNNTESTLDIVETLARKAKDGRPFSKIRLFSEVTVHDTVRMRDHLPTVRQAGFNAIWLGVEDITATLVKKAQDKDKTLQAFEYLREAGILPMPMMMHHDEQPLVSWKSNYGLINQMQIMRNSGSLFMQVMMLTPAPGSKWYEDTFSSGMAFKSVGNRQVEPHIVDANYVVASKHRRPWVKQMNLLLAYTYFFNPLRMLIALVFSKSNIPHMSEENRSDEEMAKLSFAKRFKRRSWLKLRGHLLDAGTQVYGMAGLFQTYRRTLGWGWQLFKGDIKRFDAVPVSQIPMRGIDGKPAAHALPGTPVADMPEPEGLQDKVRELVAKSG